MKNAEMKLVPIGGDVIATSGGGTRTDLFASFDVLSFKDDGNPYYLEDGKLADAYLYNSNNIDSQYNFATLSAIKQEIGGFELRNVSGLETVGDLLAFLDDESDSGKIYDGIYYWKHDDNFYYFFDKFQ